MQKVNLSILSLAISQMLNGKANNNPTAIEKAVERIKAQCEHLPSGSSIDSGVKFDLDKSTPEKMVFHVPFHHMNEGGYYDGWTTYKLTVKPSFWQGFDLNITGRDKNGVKDYLYDLFSDVFTVDHN